MVPFSRSLLSLSKHIVRGCDRGFIQYLTVCLITTIANKNFSQHPLIHETIHIKSGAWDNSGGFIYSKPHQILSRSRVCHKNVAAYPPRFAHFINTA